MNKSAGILATACSVCLFGIVQAAPSAPLKDFSSDAARITRATDEAALTAPSNKAPRDVVMEYLRGRGYSEKTLASLELVRSHTVDWTGVTHLWFAQRVQGMRVYGTYVRASVNLEGELVSVMELPSAAPKGTIAGARIQPHQALDVALKHLYPTFDQTVNRVAQRGNTTEFAKGSFFSEMPTVERVVVPFADGGLKGGFLVKTWDRDNQLNHTLVTGEGAVALVESRTQSDSYFIFPDSPGTHAQTVVPGPGAGNAESPIGWVTGNTTVGNNNDAYLDRDNDNGPDANGRPVSETADFLNPFDLTVAPIEPLNQMASVQSLFYLTNVIHDKLYRHGFTEGAGNFQVDNFGMGGVGNDPLNAEAQDGGGTNNANMSTPDDGSRPRMQMYIWTVSDPARDGSVDSDIVFHEYGHGLTWRMIGAMSGPFAGAIGEGMSDVLAILINDQDTVAEYSYNRDTGIRRYAYTDYPLTYGDLTGRSVHDDGEIYAATIWRLWEIFQANGIPQDTLFDYLVDGMNYTQPAPAYEDMRNGILESVTDPAHECLVWQAFADFGIGEGADGYIRLLRAKVRESFRLPTQCR